MNDRRQIFRFGWHLYRVAVLVVIVALVHLQHQRLIRATSDSNQAIAPEILSEVFPGFAYLGAMDNQDQQPVYDDQEQALGTVVTTSPMADHLLGFSGPTNVLIAFGEDGKVVRVQILNSFDTRDHVQQIRDDPKFLRQFNGLDREQISTLKLDGVSGATLTSMAIQESIVCRLGGQQRSLRFPGKPDVNVVGRFLPGARTLEQVEENSMDFAVIGDSGKRLGTLIRTSPAADNVVGYQGPTEAFVVFDANDHVLGLVLGKSFDNEPYVSYVREDEYFATVLSGETLESLATIDFRESEIDGVSGATMTSMAVAEGIRKMAKTVVQIKTKRQSRPAVAWLELSSVRLRDLGTIGVVILGLVIGLTRLRGNSWARRLLQILVVIYLGWFNGDLISQAMMLGWAQSGVPWQTASGLVLLTLAALIVPGVSRQNIYCSHLCPHGQLQQILKKRISWQIKLGAHLRRALKWIPPLLLVWCITVVLFGLPFSLVDIEPFDAWVIRIAGWATIVVAVVGLIGSLFIPMAYCQYGCPTGWVLNFLRFHSRADQFSGRDWIATGLMLFATAVFLLN